MTEQILGQDQAAAVLGNVFREVALLGSVTRIPQLGRVIAGWNFAQGTQRMLCAPGSPMERLGYAAETVVLLVTLKGGTGTVSLPTGGAMRSWAQGGAALLAHAGSVVTVRVPTQALAGTLAAVDSNGGMLVLLAEGNGGSGSVPTYNQVRNRVASSRQEIRLRQGRHPQGRPSDLQIANGQPFTHVKADTKYLYVIDMQGELRIAEELDAVRGIKHPQLADQQSVLGAGEVMFDRSGKIYGLNANSGRYMSIVSGQRMQQALDDAEALFHALGH